MNLPIQATFVSSPDPFAKAQILRELKESGRSVNS
jgi:hypothetical protein